MFLKLRSKSSLGIDIGTTSIKVVELTRMRPKPQLKNYGFLESYGSFERLNNPFQTSSLKILDNEVAEIISDILGEAKIQNRRAAFSIPVFSSFLTVVDFPPIPQEEIKKAIPYQARQYIPIPINEVVLDWQIIPEDHKTNTENKQHVLLTAVPKEVINKYQRIAKLARIEPTSLEVESFSNTRAVLIDNSSPVIVLDIGARSTNISVVEKGFIRISHNLDTSGEELTRVISRALAVDFRKAEEFKRSLGLKGEGGEQEISQSLIPTLDLISFEIGKILSLYDKKEKGHKITKLFLTGGSANLPGLVNYFVQKFEIEVGIANPFLNIAHPSILEPVIKEIGPAYSVAVGLAMREL